VFAGQQNGNENFGASEKTPAEDTAQSLLIMLAASSDVSVL